MSAEPPATRRVLRRIRLLPYQMRVMRSRAPYLMVPAGLGSGKSFIAAEKALRLAFENAGPEVLHLAGLCVEPTYKQVTRIMVPALRAALFRWGIEENGKGPSGYRYFKNDQMIVVRFAPGRVFTIYLASAERPDTLVGPNLCFVIFDEAGYVDPLAWNNAMPRVRHPDGKILQFMGVGTPEGFGAFYEFAEGDPKTGTELVRACTLDNRHLKPTPEAYVASQLSHFSDQEREAYVRGKFVSRGGQVYDAWDDDRHLRRFDGRFDHDVELVMGADFGYRRTVFVLGVVAREPGSWRGELVERLHVLGEVVVGRQGTLNAIPLVRDAWEALVARFDAPMGWSRIAPRITVFADSTKWQHTDRRILEREGMFVHEHGRNPLVMDRVYSVNRRLMDDLIFVDPEGAPYVAHCLRNQGYGADGFPEKPPDDGTGAPGVDHGADALGYPVFGKWPIEAPRGNLTSRRYH